MQFPIMPSLRKPSAASVNRFISEQSRLELTYKEVGATRAELPDGFHTHHIRTQLGRGEAAFAKAKAALGHWAQFSTGWTEVFPPDAAIEEGKTVAVLARVAGLWSLNACRIVYLIDEPMSYSFGYGTLPGHAESGEERFQVERNDDGSVWYDVKAFFRPRQLFARLAWPYLQRKVDQFREDSAKAMEEFTGC